MDLLTFLPSCLLSGSSVSCVPAVWERPKLVTLDPIRGTGLRPTAGRIGFVSPNLCFGGRFIITLFLSHEGSKTLAFRRGWFYCKILSVCPSGAVSPVPCGNERALWVASPRPEALTMALPHLTTPLSQGAGLTGWALPAQGGPPRIGRVDVLWPCWLGNVCVLGCSGLSVSRVPQDLTVPPGFNAPHRTGRADGPHPALRSVSHNGNSWYIRYLMRGRGSG